MKKKVYEAVGVTCAIVVFFIFLRCLGITCPIKFVTGVSCMGCGMTRAWLSVLQGNLEQAFFYHPLVFLPPVAVVAIWQKKRMKSWIYKSFWFTMIALFVIVYLCRILDANDPIVVFNPSDGIVFRMIKLNYGNFYYF